MTSIVKGLAIGAAVCVMTGSLNAANGLLIVEKSTGSSGPQTNRIQIESNRMRVESGADQVMVFDGTRQVLMMIDHSKKTYTELTQAEADKLGSQLSGAMAEMQKQLAALPPEQRAQLEAAMKGRMGGPGAGAAPKPKYREAGRDTTGKWPCTKYEGYEGERKTSEVCTVDPQALGFTEADFAVSKQMIAFFSKMVPQMADQLFSIGSQETQGYKGVPVKRSFSVGGRPMTSEITDVSRQAFPDASYAAPAGYQKTPFAGGRGR